MVMCFDFYLEAGGWLSSECLSLLVEMKVVIQNVKNLSTGTVGRKRESKSSEFEESIET